MPKRVQRMKRQAKIEILTKDEIKDLRMVKLC